MRTSIGWPAFPARSRAAVEWLQRLWTYTAPQPAHWIGSAGASCVLISSRGSGRCVNAVLVYRLLVRMGVSANTVSNGDAADAWQIEAGVSLM